MIHYAGYAPRFHPSDFETRTRDGVGADWPISLLGPEAALRARRARAAGRGAGLAVGRSAPLPARAAPDLRRAPSAPARGARARDRDARRAGRDHQRRLRQPAALHLPRLLPAGLQGQRQGAARWSRTCPTRSSTASRSAPTAWRSASRSTRRPAACTGVTYVARRARALPARRRRRRRRLLDRDAAAAAALDQRALPARPRQRHDQVGRYVMVQGAPQVAGRFPELLRMYKAPPPEVSSEEFYETDRARGFARGFSIQTVGPLPIGWAEHVLADGHWGRALREYMRDYNHWAVLGVALRAAAARREPRHARRRGRPVRDAGRRASTTRQCDNDRANIAFAKRTMHEIWEAAGAQDVLTIDRYAHLVGGCRMGSEPRGQRRGRRPPRLGRAEPLRLRRQRHAHAGRANPALTIMALASRLGARLAEGRVDAVVPRRTGAVDGGLLDGGQRRRDTPESDARGVGLRGRLTSTARRRTCCASTRCSPTASAASSSARAGTSSGCASRAGTMTRSSRRCSAAAATTPCSPTGPLRLGRVLRARHA